MRLLSSTLRSLCSVQPRLVRHAYIDMLRCTLPDPLLRLVGCALTCLFLCADLCFFRALRFLCPRLVCAPRLVCSSCLVCALRTAFCLNARCLGGKLCIAPPLLALSSGHERRSAALALRLLALRLLADRSLKAHALCLDTLGLALALCLGSLCRCTRLGLARLALKPRALSTLGALTLGALDALAPLLLLAPAELGKLAPTPVALLLALRLEHQLPLALCQLLLLLQQLLALALAPLKLVLLSLQRSALTQRNVLALALLLCRSRALLGKAPCRGLPL